MAAGIVLAKKWGQPERPLVTTSWQLIAGGALLVPLALLAEGLPSEPLTGEPPRVRVPHTDRSGTGYTLWFRGIAALPVGSITFLSLLSPVVAVIIGWVVLGQVLSGWQAAGVAVVLGAVLVVTLHPIPAPDASTTVLRRRTATSY